MNKLYKWCLLSCIAATLSSCDDFLTEENPSGLTADTFYKTASGAEALINSCYTPLRWTGICHINDRVGNGYIYSGKWLCRC